MSKRPFTIWIALAIQLLYTILWLGTAAYHISNILGLEADDPTRVFYLIRISVAFPIGVIAIITIIGLLTRKKWSKWTYTIPVIALPLLFLLDWALYELIDELEGIQDIVIVATLAALLHAPLLVGLLLITLGARSRKYFGSDKAEPENHEPPPPPIFGIE